MFDLSQIKEANAKAKEKSAERKEDFTGKLNQGMDLFRKFQESGSEKEIKEAADYFFQAIELQSNRIEPYIQISAIFHIFGLKEQAEKYLNEARKINPEAEEVRELEKLLF